MLDVLESCERAGEPQPQPEGDVHAENAFVLRTPAAEPVAPEAHKRGRDLVLAVPVAVGPSGDSSVPSVAVFPLTTSTSEQVRAPSRRQHSSSSLSRLAVEAGPAAHTVPVPDDNDGIDDVPAKKARGPLVLEAVPGTLFYFRRSAGSSAAGGGDELVRADSLADPSLPQFDGATKRQSPTPSEQDEAERAPPPKHLIRQNLELMEMSLARRHPIVELAQVLADPDKL
jgi:hypothetical protein